MPSQALNFGKFKGMTKLLLFQDDDCLSRKPNRHSKNNNIALRIGLMTLAYNKNIQK